MSLQLSFMQRDAPHWLFWLPQIYQCISLYFGTIAEDVCGDGQYYKGSTYLIQTVLIFFYMTLKELVQNSTNEQLNDFTRRQPTLNRSTQIYTVCPDGQGGQ